MNLQICDPEADPAEAAHEYGIALTPFEKLKPASTVVLAVAHKQFSEMPVEALLKLMTEKPVVIDVKSVFNAAALRKSGITVWRL